ncbi:hypothetical protein CDG81_15715 [Actinopolyspora erythraea]|uniref:DUF6286 domain-containing protein n=1 Tax=Actinopolyspora erythraea TaxID=414996 RepID=A0A099D4C5_9ACTN|nr:DUF6286 domain-containing protein [Actinopolyspora erythraea]ASU79483.1 hypothetical protein CDG81_15715 [Actinopolyspora erythraea]KGI80889.1 hypothetical protein IL38_14045 [Actinopolyspora erythraea]
MRVFVRVLTALLGLLALAAGLLLVVEAVRAAAFPGADPLPVDRATLREGLAGISWRDTAVRTGAAVTAVIGLLLILVAARAGRGYIRLHDPAPEVVVVTRPRALARMVGHLVREQDGVARASVVARRKAVRVNAVSEFTEVGDLEPRLRETARAATEELPLVTTPKVSVAVKPARKR